MNLNDQNLIWIDLEMTGLDTRNDAILEIATAVTNAQLSEVVQGPAIAIGQPEDVLKGMDKWNQSHHSKSGLLKAVRESDADYASAAEQTLRFFQQHVPSGKSPMCGNTICQDRRFLARLMPEVEQYFHYRHLDVSTLKECAKRWRPELSEKAEDDKTAKHRAMDDVLESIEELRFYRKTFFRLP